MKKIFPLILFLVLTTTSCVSTPITTKGSYVRLMPGIGAQVDVDEAAASKITAFYQRMPDFPFDEVGIIEAVAYGDGVGLNDLFPELRLQTLRAGGTAFYKIQLTRLNQTGDMLHATAIAIAPARAKP